MPERYMVRNAGAMFAEVVLIAYKETEASETAIQYAVVTPRKWIFSFCES